MISTDIKSLIGKLNSATTTFLYKAGGLAVNRTHYEVGVEHFLLEGLGAADYDLAHIMDYFQIDRVGLQNSLNKALESFVSGNTGRPTFSDVLLNLLEASWATASLDLNLNKIRTGAIILAYARRPLSYSQGGALPELKKIAKDDLAENFFKILATSLETKADLEPTSEASSQAASVGSGDSFLAKYCEDFTAKAARGEIDPVFGRDQEIRSMVNILARRRKNNPIVVGEPGVGKTAVVEGLAKRIHEGDVPSTLKGVTLLSLDMGLLEAGASLKGEFERRLKGVIDEIKTSPKPIILFIDEAHALVGAGGTAGGSDAANLLKPALARGEVKTCAATTWKEYKKYFEKDAALARRFQLVSVGEPSAETCLLILRGLKQYYESSHGVSIRDEALKTAAIMSDRYISGRYLPDKAVDLLDTACARVKVGLAAKPPILEDAQRKLAALEREKAGLARDEATGSIDQERFKALLQEIEVLTARIANFNEVWQAQKEGALGVIAARQEFLRLKDESDKAASDKAETDLASPTPPKVVASEVSAPDLAAPESSAPELNSPEPTAPELTPLERAQRDLNEAQDKWRAASENQPDELKDLLDIEVTNETIAKVVSDWTGVPVGSLAAEEAQLIANLPERLGQRVKGQDQALASIAKVIQASKAGLRDQAQPLGVFLLVGPSGVGKTETGLALAELLFGDDKSVLSINMSEFQERHTVSRLVGSPPGYVGYGEGGLLTEAIRQRPYSVLLLDECEKAHLDVMNLFYQVFDKGVLTDAEGKKVSFANTIILLTSNLAADVMENLTQANPSLDLKALTEAIRPYLTKHFQPAFLARVNIAPYRSLDHDSLIQIARLKLAALAQRLANNAGTTLNYDDEVVEAIIERCLNTQTGARDIDHILSSGVTPQMAQDILGYMSTGQTMPKTITLGLDENRAFAIRFDG
ncbi:MAG: type VI secretion system ATPase TssH [Deltaproteobacteria bacterium]|jgi:type VI secretion system protein VasG|nr:type VI secretion system ATPase TssH [Deltaproteobacteria bacterium]